jgi:hypothetical protein
MNKLVFLLEEYSMKVLLDGLLPRLYPELTFQCVPHDGRNDLEKSVPRKLRAWKEPGVSFIVLRDNDSGDCTTLKTRLMAICRDAGRDDTLVRIACQELEAWFFGEPEALAEAFGKPELAEIARKAKYRESDAIDSPSRELVELIPEFQKVSGARLLATHLSRERNRSKSFHTLLQGIDYLHLGNDRPGRPKQTDLFEEEGY